MDVAGRDGDGALPPLRAALAALVVEDCPAHAEAMRLLVRGAGLRVRHAATLAAARRHLATFRPVALLVDLGLPDGDGLGLLREVAALGPARPVLVAVSADPAQLDRPAVREAADARLEKPFDSVLAFRSRLASLMPELAAPAGPRARHLPARLPEPADA